MSHNESFDSALILTEPLQHTRSSSTSTPDSTGSTTAMHFAYQLDAIRASLDILDFKTAIQLSTAAIIVHTEENISDLPNALSESYYFRSIAHEKSGLLSLSIEDAHKAVESNGKDPKYHIRVALAYQAAALCSIDLAHQRFDQEDEGGSTLNLSTSSLLTTRQQMLNVQDLERKSPFRRVSPEQFIKIISSCSPPSLALAMAVTRRWRKSILSNTDLFSHFRMEGHCSNICEGLEFFKKQSKNTIKSIEIDVQEQTSQDVTRLRSIITSLSSKLEVLSIEHTGPLGIIFGNILDSCSHLKVIKSTVTKTGEQQTGQDREIRLCGGKREMRLQALIWHQNSYDIKWDSFPASKFKHLKHIDAKSKRLNAEWLIKVLTNCQKLEKIRISGSTSEEWETSIPPLDLVQLKSLEVQVTPTNSDGGPSFFSQLDAPKLERLKASTLALMDLQEFKFINGLKELDIENIDSQDRPSLGERDASELLDILEGADSLQNLALSIKASRTNYKFWTYLLSVLTPLSFHNSRKGGGGVYIILPALETLKLGALDPHQTPSVLPSELGLDDEFVGRIASLVTSRHYASRGFSESVVCLAANGLSVGEHPEKEDAKNFLLRGYRSISSLHVDMNIKAERRYIDLIQKYVSKLELPDSWLEEGLE